MERARLQGIPVGAAFGQTARSLRQLRTALESVSGPVHEGGLQRPAVVSAIIPCIDEEAAIGSVVVAVLAHGATEVVVVDGGSRDRTVERAAAAGGRTVIEPKRGYGRAIQAGIASVRDDVEILVFLDGDGSDPTEFIPALIAPIVAGEADFVLGSRIRGTREPGSLAPQQIVAGYIARVLLRLCYGARFTDLSPFRAIRSDALAGLGMTDLAYGWNLEMLMRVAAAGLQATEIAVGQRRRVGGVSKVSGNFIVGLKAAFSLVSTFVRLALQLRGEPRR